MTYAWAIVPLRASPNAARPRRARWPAAPAMTAARAPRAWRRRRRGRAGPRSRRTGRPAHARRDPGGLRRDHRLAGHAVDQERLRPAAPRSAGAVTSRIGSFPNTTSPSGTAQDVAGEAQLGEVARGTRSEQAERAEVVDVAGDSKRSALEVVDGVVQAGRRPGSSLVAGSDRTNSSKVAVAVEPVAEVARRHRELVEVDEEREIGLADELQSELDPGCAHARRGRDRRRPARGRRPPWRRATPSCRTQPRPRRGRSPSRSSRWPSPTMTTASTPAAAEQLGERRWRSRRR